MNILRDILSRSALLIIIVFASSILYDNNDLKLTIAEYLSPKPNYSSNEELFKRHRAECEQRNKDFSIMRTYCSEDIDQYTIKLMRHGEEINYNSEYIYPKEKIIKTASGLVLALSVFLLTIRLFLNLHKFFKGRLNMDFPNILRKFFNFFSSRMAELELMRYKRLFENEVITEEEFSEKKKELKSKIIG